MWTDSGRTAETTGRGPWATASLLGALLLALASLPTCTRGSEEALPEPVSTTARVADPSLEILRFGPKTTEAGRRFNVQRDGVSALWFKSQGATRDTIVVFGEEELHSAFKEGTVTARVPWELIGEPGRIPVHLYDKATGLRSDLVYFVIEPSTEARRRSERRLGELSYRPDALERPADDPGRALGALSLPPETDVPE